MQSSQGWPLSPIFLALIAAFLFCAVWMLYRPDHARWLVFPFVFIGFIIALCLHEFGHAIVAYHCGDTTVREKGYLTLDPLRYTDVQYSIVFPLLIMVLGGIGLPGAAVYINTHYLRRRIDGAFVSAGGPLGTAVVLAVLMVVLKAAPDLVQKAPILYAALAFLALLQVTALIFNLIPCPGLDGWGIVEPFFPRRCATWAGGWGCGGRSSWWRRCFWCLGSIDAFWQFVLDACALIGLDSRAAFLGYKFFQFWR